MSVPLWLVYLFVFMGIWMPVSGFFDPAQVVWSLVVGVCTLPFAKRILDLDRSIGLGRLFRSALGFWAVFLFLFIPDAVRSTLDIARRVLTPKIPMHPGIIAIPIEFRGPIDTLLLCNHLTLTPGTVVVDLMPEKGLLYLHVIDARERETIRRQVRELHSKAWRIMNP